jgi:hypothetical protein
MKKNALRDSLLMIVIGVGLTRSGLGQDASGKMTADLRRQVIEAATLELEAKYVYPDAGKAMGARLLANLKAGAYDRIDDPEDLAKRLESDLQTVHADKHLELVYVGDHIIGAGGGSGLSPKTLARLRDFERFSNFDFQKVERLPGNVGVLVIKAITGGPEMRATVAGAMAFLANTDALILDLRECQGGGGETLTYLCSYFFEDRTELTGFYDRIANKLERRWTQRVSGPKYLDKPVFVLTSSKTPSAAESLAYTLQAAKRAIIVGQTTWGGANPSMPVKLTDHFGMIMPFGRAVNPITHGNWEGTGVIPDIKSEAPQALIEAYRRALQDVQANYQDEWMREEIQKALEALKR